MDIFKFVLPLHKLEPAATVHVQLTWQIPLLTTIYDRDLMPTCTCDLNQITFDNDHPNLAEYRHCSNIRGHFPSSDGSDSARTFSCTSVTIAQLNLPVISLVCLALRMSTMRRRTGNLDPSGRYAAVCMMVSENR